MERFFQGIILIIAFSASVIGNICGMGGGVIIKPALDAYGALSVSSVNFISGCTVIGMSLWSVFRSFSKKEGVIRTHITTPLAIGACFGGILGKILFVQLAGRLSSENSAGGVQAALLLCATAATFLYTRRKERIRSLHIENCLPCLAIGLGLGTLSSFLGIGGGPFNIAVLYYFFSMQTKEASQNSLFVILFSQIVSMIVSFLSGYRIDIAPLWIAGMVACGILGSICGRRISQKLNDKKVTFLFLAVMILVMLICVYNMVRFFGGQGV